LINNRLLASALAFVLVAGIGPSIESSFAVPGQGTLYATEPINNELWTIDPSNGDATFIGNTFDGEDDVRIPSLAVHPFTGVMYGGGGSGDTNLYIVNPSNGDLTLVGSTGDDNPVGLDFRADGTLFAALHPVGQSNVGGDRLGIINPANGDTTVVGSFGVEQLNGIAFFGGILYGVSYNDELYTINTGTGEATLLAGVSPSHNLGASQFACDGTFYVGGQGDEFGTLDITTGDFNLIASPVVDEVIGGFAFIENCQVVGGEFMSIDTTALMLAGLQSSAIWMLPVLAGVVGSAFGVLYIKSRRN